MGCARVLYVYRYEGITFAVSITRAREIERWLMGFERILTAMWVNFSVWNVGFTFMVEVEIYF